MPCSLPEIFLRKDRKMIKKDISSESWRNYEWIIPETGKLRSVMIVNPQSLYYEKESSCHVVTAFDPGRSTMELIAYCVPSVGRYGCVLTWGKKDGSNPVLFASASKEDERCSLK